MFETSTLHASILSTWKVEGAGKVLGSRGARVAKGVVGIQQAAVDTAGAAAQQHARLPYI